MGDSNSHTGVVLHFEAECHDNADGQTKEVFRTFLYVADTSSSAGTSWAKSWPLHALSAEIVDWNDDGQEDEVQLILIAEGSDTVTGKVFVFNRADGTKLSERGYPLVRLL